MKTPTLPFYEDWPEVKSKIAKDPVIEQQVGLILSKMTLEEKIGQMIQPELFNVTPEEAFDYKLGSILNGAGVWPENNKYCTAQQWSQTIEGYWQAVQNAFADRGFTIPLLWATDAVHGHNNVFGATVFPHNIGLGCANDAELIQRIGRATAREIGATGIDWTFAPTVTTPRDLRWGRHYEGYSEDPEIVAHYAAHMVQGLQGDAQDLKGDDHVISNVKHWLGDGGTWQGVDRGVNRYSEAELLNIHAHGYIEALRAGAQVVMTSFSSWDNSANYGISDQDSEYNYKMHGSHYLNTIVLKEKMGFDGIVVTDWDGHSEVTDSSLGNANYSVRSGVDIVMVAARQDWQSVYRNLLEAVRDGEVPLTRIDDAVTRILRVKARAGLWHKPSPTQRRLAKNPDLLGCDEHQAIARESVRKSLVLLKNNHKVLPLAPTQKILLTGSAADNICKQTGGWSLSWQGSDNTLKDFPKGDTLRSALIDSLNGDLVIFDPELSQLAEFTSKEKVAVVAIGEDAYAEMRGDISPWRSVVFSELKASYKKDLELIETLSKQGFKVVTVFFSGRPLMVNRELELSDAFVAAWLPGTQSKGITDVLIKNTEGTPNYDFTGKLSFSWPAKAESYAVNHVRDQVKVPATEAENGGNDLPLFPYGYGLSYQSENCEAEQYLERMSSERTHHRPQLAAASSDLTVLKGLNHGGYQVRIAGRSNWMGQEVNSVGSTEQIGGKVDVLQCEEKGYHYQVEFFGHEFLFYLEPRHEPCENFSSYSAAEGALVLTIKLMEAPKGPVILANHSEYPNQPGVDIQALLQECPLSEWTTLRIPLNALESAGCDLKLTSSPLMLFSEQAWIVGVANVCWSVNQNGEVL